MEVEVGLARGVYADEVIPQLDAHTDCEVSITSHPVMIKEHRPVELTVSEVLCFLTDQLRGLLRAELEHELGQLQEQQRWLDLERVFIVNRVYARIEEATTEEQVYDEVDEGMRPHLAELEVELTREDIDRLLKIPIRRISRWDIDRNRRNLERIAKAIKEVRRKLRDMTATTIDYLEELLASYGDRYPRRSEISSFETVDVRAVARQNLKVSYDPDTGFFGTDVKGSKHQLQVSEYDRILLVSRDGSYRIVGAEEKILIPDKVIHCQLFDPDEGARFTVVYRTDERMAYAKKVHIKAFIRDREYELVPDKKGRVDLLLEGDADDVLHLDYVPKKRQRVHNTTFDLSELDFVGVTAKGRRLAPKPVARLKRLRGEEAEQARVDQSGDDASDSTDQGNLF